MIHIIRNKKAYQADKPASLRARCSRAKKESRRFLSVMPAKNCGQNYIYNYIYNLFKIIIKGYVFRSQSGGQRMSGNIYV